MRVFFSFFFFCKNVEILIRINRVTGISNRSVAQNVFLSVSMLELWYGRLFYLLSTLLCAYIWLLLVLICISIFHQSSYLFCCICASLLWGYLYRCNVVAIHIPYKPFHLSESFMLFYRWVNMWSHDKKSIIFFCLSWVVSHHHHTKCIYVDTAM